MFEGFSERRLECERGTIFARVGGTGPPLLLLHGYPENHLMWHAVAPVLGERFTVVAADLTGYGGSLRPQPSADHAAHGKRALALDQLQAMGSLGYERFAVAGHDRGGRVAYRLALDHPGRVSALAVLDIVPTADVWARADDRFPLIYWHWGFLAQPAPLPERLIAGDPGAYFEHMRALGLGREPGRYPEEVLAAYRAQLEDPATVEAMCEDYRAGASVDREYDEADRGRTIECPVLALWGKRGALEIFYGDVLAVWRAWARELHGRGVDASHFLVEDRPGEVARELAAFFAASPAPALG
ncbi:MAG: alpha/beta hydrolase [Solirubrobacterales bacterium]|nr:alpha/beta hydrolase [Solirubrobacterales bacterium]MBV9716992.1 alpha/beta hydrolase [Solirubrobacterales bacterium]